VRDLTLGKRHQGVFVDAPVGERGNERDHRSGHAGKQLEHVILP